MPQLCPLKRNPPRISMLPSLQCMPSTSLSVAPAPGCVHTSIKLHNAKLANALQEPKRTYVLLAPMPSVDKLCTSSKRQSGPHWTFCSVPERALETPQGCHRTSCSLRQLHHSGIVGSTGDGSDVDFSLPARRGGGAFGGIFLPLPLTWMCGICTKGVPCLCFGTAGRGFLVLTTLIISSWDLASVVAPRPAVTACRLGVCTPGRSFTPRRRRR